MRLTALLLGGCLWLWSAEVRLTVDQLVSFITSSIQLGHSDKRVADYLKNVILTERLDARVVEELQRRGAGPRTLDELEKLRERSKNLPPPGGRRDQPEPPPLPPPGPEEQQRIIERVRQYALEYTRRLPDFICLEVTRRYVDPTGLEFWRHVDTVTARLTYFEQREEYRVVLINDRPVDMSIEELEGSTSTGEFGTMLREIFEPRTETTFRWERWGKLRGRITHVYSYFVRKDRSNWTITYQKRLHTIPAYRGLVYIDRDTLQVLRVTLEAVDIDPEFPVREARTTLDYDYVDIGGQQYLLPLRFVMQMREAKLLVKNEVEFRNYRKFAADAVIKFETPEPLPEEVVTEQPVQPQRQK